MDLQDKENAPNFIRQIIENDLRSGKHNTVVTRFPPEPNGYLHIGHAKSISLNFGLSREFKGKCHLRFDDTNPIKEEAIYTEAIKEDVRWLGFDWGDHLYHASDYFDKLYDYAIKLIEMGKAYVCSLSPDEIRQHRGTLKESGKDSPYRNRTIHENLELFEKMRAGQFKEGEHVLRARIDMASPNLNMRDPVLYRIMKASHFRTGSTWNIYPTYDFAHCLSDAIEGITHSICTLEFEDHRPLYDWILDQLQTKCHPQQIEFARLNLSYTFLSKRKLIRLVRDGCVSGWDDPRMPTISGMRRRGFPPEAIRNFMDRIGVSKREGIVDITLLEYHVREVLNKSAPRVMAVLRPLKVVIENYPEDQSEELEAINNPEDESTGTRKVPFGRVLYIEQDDFMEEPIKKFFRLAPGREVRLRYAYFIKCVGMIKNPNTGEIVELRCIFDPSTHGGNAPDGRKVKATIHWVSAAHGIKSEVRLYNYLFTKSNPEDVEEEKDLTANINHESLDVLKECYIEPHIKEARPGMSYQFERLGYFCIDVKDSRYDKPVFNRTLTLKDPWAKIQKQTL